MISCQKQTVCCAGLISGVFSDLSCRFVHVSVSVVPTRHSSARARRPVSSLVCTLPVLLQFEPQPSLFLFHNLHALSRPIVTRSFIWFPSSGPFLAVYMSVSPFSQFQFLWFTLLSAHPHPLSHCLPLSRSLPPLSFSNSLSVHSVRVSAPTRPILLSPVSCRHGLTISQSYQALGLRVFAGILFHRYF